MYKFKDNKYTKWYFKIIKNAKNRKIYGDYTEKHHIIPKCIGGTNSKDNLIKLTAREHFIVHLLLIKMVNVNDVYRMVCAVVRFRHKVTNSRQYELLRKYVSRYSCGKYNKSYGKMWAYNKKTLEILFIDKKDFSSTLYISGLPYQRGGTKGNKWINDGKKETLIPKTSKIPNGWQVGRIFKPSKSQMSNINKARHTKEKDNAHSKTMTGRIQIYNERLNKVKRIHPSRINEYFENGWIIKNVPTKKSVPVIINGIKYATQSEAAATLGITASTVWGRVNSKSDCWKEWKCY